MSFSTAYLTPRETSVWDLRRKKNTQSEIGRLMGFSRQASHKTLELVDVKVEKAFEEAASTNGLEVIPANNEKSSNKLWPALQILGIALIIVLSITAIFLNNELITLRNSNNELNRITNEQNAQLSKLNATIMNLRYTVIRDENNIKELNHTVVTDDLIQRGYRNLFFSNVTPPITKPDAVRRALNYGNWTEDKLTGKVIAATLQWVVFESTEGNLIYGFASIEEVTQPRDDYSPIQEGNLVFRYVWKVEVMFVHPVDVEYYVDASNGEVFITPTYLEPN
jgi:cell division protein FtsL